MLLLPVVALVVVAPRLIIVRVVALVVLAVIGLMWPAKVPVVVLPLKLVFY
jgi:hypothetical protein